MQIQFGIGGVLIRPNGGNAATPSWPQQLFTIQEGSIDTTTKLEKLMGQNKGPDDVAPSDMETKFKSGFAYMSPDLYNSLAFGDTVATGTTNTGSAIPVIQEKHAIPTTPFQVTIAPPNSGTFAKDLGVTFANQITYQLQRVTGTPTTGQYAVNESSGVYTFASADEVSGYSVLISYSYTETTVGRLLTVTNHIQGYGPTCEVFIPMTYQGGNNLSLSGGAAYNSLHVRNMRISKIGWPMKRNGYMISDLEGECFPDGTGAILDFFQTNAG